MVIFAIGAVFDNPTLFVSQHLKWMCFPLIILTWNSSILETLKSVAQPRISQFFLLNSLTCINFPDKSISHFISHQTVFELSTRKVNRYLRFPQKNLSPSGNPDLEKKTVPLEIPKEYPFTLGVLRCDMPCSIDNLWTHPNYVMFVTQLWTYLL